MITFQCNRELSYDDQNLIKIVFEKQPEKQHQIDYFTISSVLLGFLLHILFCISSAHLV